MLKFPNKHNALTTLEQVGNKELNGTVGFYWAVIQMLAGIVFAILHVADVLETKR